MPPPPRAEDTLCRFPPVLAPPLLFGPAPSWPPLRPSGRGGRAAPRQAAGPRGGPGSARLMPGSPPAPPGPARSGPARAARRYLARPPRCPPPRRPHTDNMAEAQGSAASRRDQSEAGRKRKPLPSRRAAAAGRGGASRFVPRRRSGFWEG